MTSNWCLDWRKGTSQAGSIYLASTVFCRVVHSLRNEVWSGRWRYAHPANNRYQWAPVKWLDLWYVSWYCGKYKCNMSRKQNAGGPTFFGPTLVFGMYGWRGPLWWPLFPALGLFIDPFSLPTGQPPLPASSLFFVPGDRPTTCFEAPSLGVFSGIGLICRRAHGVFMGIFLKWVGWPERLVTNWNPVSLCAPYIYS